MYFKININGVVFLQTEGYFWRLQKTTNKGRFVENGISGQSYKRNDATIRSRTGNWTQNTKRFTSL